MSDYIDEMNTLVRTKSEFKNIIQEAGAVASEVFSTYPDQIRSIIANGGMSSDLINSYISAYLSEYNYIDSDALNAYNYIDATELSACGYITASDIPDISTKADKSELSNYLLAPTVSGYTGAMRLYNDGFFEVTSIGNVRVKTFSYNALNTWNAYTLINRDSLRNYVNGRLAEIEASYATTTDLNNYLPYLGTLKAHYTNSEHFIPKGNNTYYLGNINFKWQRIYTYNLYTNTAYFGDYHSISPISQYQLGVSINNTLRYAFLSGGLQPVQNNLLLGTSDHYWGSTYSTNIYTENVSYTSGKSSIKMNDRNIDFYANNKKMINLSDYNGFVPKQTNVNLGGSSNKWGSTYTTDLYADNIHNFIWTGTSAEYASLDNYTSYQIYLIKEA